jgi:hypothetical protein
MGKRLGKVLSGVWRVDLRAAYRPSSTRTGPDQCQGNGSRPCSGKTAVRVALTSRSSQVEGS